MTAKQFKEELKNLSLEELFDLDVTIWDRIEELRQSDQQEPISPKFLQELKHIQKQMNEGTTTMISWEDVQQHIEAQRAQL